MLALEEWIAESDDELEIWASVTVGFEDDKKLAVKLEYIDYGEEGHNRILLALVTFEDAYNMSKHLNVRLTELPLAIKERCGYRSATLRPSQMETCFKEVLDFFVSCGVNYKLLD